MRLAVAIELYAYGTSEGASKGWDTRGRGRKQQPTAELKVSELKKLHNFGHAAIVSPDGKVVADKAGELGYHRYQVLSLPGFKKYDTDETGVRVVNEFQRQGGIRLVHPNDNEVLVTVGKASPAVIKRVLAVLDHIPLVDNVLFEHRGPADWV